MNLKIGDVVRLKGQSEPKMTLTDFVNLGDNKHAKCTYFFNGQFVDRLFLPNLLVVVEDKIDYVLHSCPCVHKTC